VRVPIRCSRTSSLPGGSVGRARKPLGLPLPEREPGDRGPTLGTRLARNLRRARPLQRLHGYDPIADRGGLFSTSRSLRNDSAAPWNHGALAAMTTPIPRRGQRWRPWQRFSAAR
jgi:hypothetical protein